MIERLARAHWWARHSDEHETPLEGKANPAVERAWASVRATEVAAMQAALSSVTVAALVG